ncbi:ogr/Delta-like zinc finger family protein [Salinicola corii]|uniref:Ogr/Delta-like zinc finger family protein n=1 Tax=Salinicola corii TaxID=2606937 RepID=A0A640W9P2_9GAMM|nr:ogr/Delta-like zinc finger family protein [Salinicola corii]KAA0016655.1 ogr/Delta-like zinc finger family protein [Salinicola corii]
MTKPAQARNTCPHCGSYARVRYSKQVTPIYREGAIECQNADCGWRGKFSFEFTVTLTPSMTPNPDITLPVSAGVRATMLAQLLRESS